MSTRTRLKEDEYDYLCEYRKSVNKKFVPKENFKLNSRTTYRARLSDAEFKMISCYRNLKSGKIERSVTINNVEDIEPFLNDTECIEVNLNSGKQCLQTINEKSIDIDSISKKGLGSVKFEYEKEDDIVSKLRERYTDKELALLVKGEGLHDKQLDYPTIHLHGKHHKMGIISDGHLGSKYSPIEWHLEAFKTFEKENCDCILHAGDMVDGLTPRRISTQIYELTHIGYKSQRDLAIDVFSKSKLPIFVISGNHDNYFKEFAGANIVEDICNAVPKMTYLGDNQADLNIDGVIIRLFHGGDGNSYALSYRLQKLIESFTGGKKPNILLAGHVHKFCYIFDRHVHAISIPTLQMQTGFMQGKKLAAHTGFLIMEFDTFEGSVSNFEVKLYPFYG